MTAEEAIVVNRKIFKSLRDSGHDEWAKATKLGLEALTWLSERRKTSPALANIFLPSETIPCRK